MKKGGGGAEIAIFAGKEGGGKSCTSSVEAAIDCVLPLPKKREGFCFLSLAEGEKGGSRTPVSQGEG